jgi:pimeloyl-ACP methyl ester carboxylesterase
MRVWLIAAGTLLAAVVAAVAGRAIQSRAGAIDESVLRELAGTYQWESGSYLDLEIWSELSGTNQLVALEETGEIRTLYPSEPDRFVAGPAAALPKPIESRIEFVRDEGGAVTALTWRREGQPPRTARRAAVERREDVQFSHAGVRLAATFISPAAVRRHPAIVLVHGSGAARREQILPFARFLIRQGVAVLAYDKRGVGGSTGDWKSASFDDLAGDAVAAFEYLKSRSDVDPERIGLLGLSQAGWIMPLAAVRAPGIAFMISLSGPGVPAAETTIDHARNEMMAGGMPAPAVERITGLMRLQYEFARTGEGWDAYLAARAGIASRMGAPPDAFPGTKDDPHWDVIRRLYLYDPASTLRQLRTPTLALFGELDNNVLPAKNSAAWDAALKAAGNGDYTIRILPKANHIYLEARAGSNAEMPSLQRFVPDYRATIREWLGQRVSPAGSSR